MPLDYWGKRPYKNGHFGNIYMYITFTLHTSSEYFGIISVTKAYIDRGVIPFIVSFQIAVDISVTVALTYYASR